MATDPARLLPAHSNRSASFENPTAEAGAAGRAAAGRKGAANRIIRPGERVRLLDVGGPGRITHLWATFASAAGPTSPAVVRAQLIEVFYDGEPAPSVSVPAGDFFGAAHGMRVPYASALTAINEGRGFSSRVPMPFGEAAVLDWENRSDLPVVLYYQADVLAGPLEPETGYLHGSFRRENPTELGRDFTVAGELRGPGRFLGWTGGVRVLEPSRWWGEGEVKMYIDSDTDHPTVCGTGTEDYLDSAWGLGTFSTPESGAAVWAAGDGPDEHHRLVSFYRWHVSDPVVFRDRLRVTVQQIGSAFFPAGDAESEAFTRSHRLAGEGLIDMASGSFCLYERSDDWCATAFTYCATPQAVPGCDMTVAGADLPAGRSGLRLVRRH
ncbi:MAG TPA: glycoside hydrolase family 172 protein [Acidimicrobiales bacterium]|nr:glycoside hydrolase family 172 protein [Acidimicrobiales bacterium]